MVQSCLREVGHIFSIGYCGSSRKEECTTLVVGPKGFKTEDGQGAPRPKGIRWSIGPLCFMRHGRVAWFLFPYFLSTCSGCFLLLGLGLLSHLGLATLLGADLGH